MMPDPLKTDGPTIRSAWLTLLERLARPVLGAMAEGKLRATMPVETCGGAPRDDRARFTHLEAIGRLLCGIAPWLELDGDDAFWHDAPTAWTSVRANRGDDLAADHALHD